MNTFEAMLKSHPASASSTDSFSERTSLIAEAVEVIQRCATICASCADACIGEADVDRLRECIRTDLDCADVCQATASILTRQTETNWELVRAQLSACISACRICAADCREHADHHDHCRICAESCEECEGVCQRVLDAIAA